MGQLYLLIWQLLWVKLNIIISLEWLENHYGGDSIQSAPDLLLVYFHV